jgi:hypothetical protein
MGLSFTIVAGLASAVILRSESRGTHEHILLSQIRDSPNLEGQDAVFISPKNRVARLYSQALGSLFVASYDSPEVSLLQLTAGTCLSSRYPAAGRYVTI